jgi:hypothetical protein
MRLSRRAGAILLDVVRSGCYRKQAFGHLKGESGR